MYEISPSYKKSKSVTPQRSNTVLSVMKKYNVEDPEITR